MLQIGLELSPILGEQYKKTPQYQKEHSQMKMGQNEIKMVQPQTVSDATTYQIK